MTTKPIDACAAAIAGVRSKYEIVRRSYDYNLYGIWQRDDHTGFTLPFVFSAETFAECQAWIDRQAARACVVVLRDAAIETGGEPYDGDCPAAWLDDLLNEPAAITKQEGRTCIACGQQNCTDVLCKEGSI